jgi:hypothetical protein
VEVNNERTALGCVIILWLVYAALGLAFWGFIAWCIYLLVTK